MNIWVTFVHFNTITKFQDNSQETLGGSLSTTSPANNTKLLVITAVWSEYKR